jgi:uncharacterized iron-regulated membrane protein
MRLFWVAIHRWVGLVIAGFLLIAGLTGALLVWYQELDSWINSASIRVQPTYNSEQQLDPIDLRDRLQMRYPDWQINWVNLYTPANQAVTFWLEPPINSDSATSAVDNQLLVNPYTGEVIGSRQWGDITQGVRNLMPFIYRLHYQLALGTVGTWTFGIIALLWALDCFVGAYLTLPARLRPKLAHDVNVSPPLRHWTVRWISAWKLRVQSGFYKFNFDLHRAGGLWMWAILFVIAWSAVGLNLNQVYRPVMSVFFEHQDTDELIRVLPQPILTPALSWQEAYQKGQEAMGNQAKQQSFQVLRPESLSYDPRQGIFRYRVKSDRDVSDKVGQTYLYIDAMTGERLSDVYLPVGKASGDTITNWLNALHFAQVWGTPWRIVITVTGILVVLLSTTGVYIWWKKRRSRLIAVNSAKRSSLII